MDNNTVEIQQNNIQPQQMNYDQSQMQYQNMQPGHGQFCFYEDELQNVNWYVYKDDYSNGEYEKVLKTIKEYYTDEYGEPSERDDDDDYLERLRWDCGKNKRYELDVEEDMFVLRYRYSKY